MEKKRYFHLLCTDGEKVRYEGRFQCRTKIEAYRLLRTKIERKDLRGLKYTITEFPVDVLREIVEAIIKQKPLPEGDVRRDDGFIPPPKNPNGNSKYFSLTDHRRNPNAPTTGNVKRRLGDI